jgi:PadR family transcriptional regulator PadR
VRYLSQSLNGNNKKWDKGLLPIPYFCIDRTQLVLKAIDKNNTSRYDVLHEGRYSMDIQLKRGLLDVCVLVAIKNEDSYGYKIIKDVKPYVELSESTLYTILKRLEGAGMLTVRTSEHDGRLRKYYHITKKGLSRLEDFKNEWREVMSIYKFVTKEENGND